MIRDVGKARDDYWSLLEEAKGQETEASKKVEPRFAIRSFVDEKGKTKYYVKADGSRVLHGRDPAKWAIQIENYIHSGRPDTRKYCGKRTSQMQRSFSSADT